MKNLFPLAMLLCMAACQKSPPDRSHVGGRVLEFGTGEPIVGAKVHISTWSGSIGGGGSGGTSILAATTHSNSDGYYDFDNLDGNRVLLVNATKEGYFTDLDTEEIVLDDGNYDDVDVSLPPHAWLRVTIRNESGSFGFFPDRDGSGYPPIQLTQGSDTTLAVDLRKGNYTTKYTFSVRTEENGSFPGPDYWQQVTAFANGNPVNVQVGVGAFLDFFLVGHDTTHLTIIY